MKHGTVLTPQNGKRVFAKRGAYCDFLGTRVWHIRSHRLGMPLHMHFDYGEPLPRPWKIAR